MFKVAEGTVSIGKSSPPPEQSKYPWGKIEVGQSFFITVVNDYPQISSLRSECSRRNKKAKPEGYYFTARVLRDNMIGKRIEVAKKKFPQT